MYFRFTIHRNPIIVVNAFNSPATHRRAVTIDALLIIGMTKAISDRVMRRQRGNGAVSILSLSVRAIFLMERIFLM